MADIPHESIELCLMPVVLRTSGAVCWMIQLLPQVWKSWREDLLQLAEIQVALSPDEFSHLVWVQLAETISAQPTSTGRDGFGDRPTLLIFRLSAEGASGLACRAARDCKPGEVSRTKRRGVMDYLVCVPWAVAGRGAHSCATFIFWSTFPL